MSDFTASNGVELDWCGGVISTPGDIWEANHEARKEFYQHLRDKELGRWRDPEAPNFVVYTPASDNPDRIRVVDETAGNAVTHNRGGTDSFYYCDTAKRYFAAHPEPEPKPWLDAEPGEVWVLEVWGEELAYIRTATQFTNWGTPTQSPTDTEIKSGYRIWPEGAK